MAGEDRWREWGLLISVVDGCREGEKNRPSCIQC
jgi:hypothetical protein